MILQDGTETVSSEISFGIVHKMLHFPGTFGGKYSCLYLFPIVSGAHRELMEGH